MKKDKRGQIDLPVILLVVLMIIILAGLGYLIYQYYSDTYVDCGIGKLKTIDGKKVCVFNISSTIICPSGFVYDEGRNICVFEPQTERVCNQGIYNPTTGNCEILLNVSNVCSNGILEFAHNEWRCRVEVNNTVSRNTSGLLTCAQYGKSKCINGQICNGTVKLAADTANCCSGVCVDNISILNVCGNGKCDLEETAANCPRDCYSENLPYSVLAIHEETWGGMDKMVELANKYNTKLSIFFWPGVVDYILSNQTAIEMVHQWQAQGHEIGIHNQQCDTSGKNSILEFGPDDAVKYEQLAAPYKIQSGTSGCAYWLPDSYKYNIGMNRVDGRTSRALKAEMITGRQLYIINGKPNYVGTPSSCGSTDLKIEQYMTLNPNEVYGFMAHTLEISGCDDVPISLVSSKYCQNLDDYNGGHSVVPFENWLKFLYDKDPEGKRRVTLSKLMEDYMIPNNLVVSTSEICSNMSREINKCSSILWKSNPDSRPSGVSAKDFVDVCFPLGCSDQCDTNLFNFGRCLDTGTTCEYNSSWSIENGYCPRGCVSKRF